MTEAINAAPSTITNGWRSGLNMFAAADIEDTADLGHPTDANLINISYDHATPTTTWRPADSRDNKVNADDEQTERAPADASRLLLSQAAKDTLGELQLQQPDEVEAGDGSQAAESFVLDSVVEDSAVVADKVTRLEICPKKKKKKELFNDAISAVEKAMRDVGDQIADEKGATTRFEFAVTEIDKKLQLLGTSRSAKQLRAWAGNRLSTAKGGDVSGQKRDESVFLPTRNQLGAPPKKRKKKAEPMPVTNGLSPGTMSSNNGSFLWTEVDSILFNMAQYNQKLAFVCLVTSWCKKKDAHYFRDARLTVSIVASTLGYTVPEYLRLRGWTIRRKDGRLIPEYRKMRHLLLESKESGRFIHLCAMIVRCVKQLRNDAHLEQRIMVQCATKIRDRITRLTQAYHTAFSAVVETMSMIHPLFASATQHHKAIHIVDKIFAGCETRKQIIRSCHLLFVTFQDNLSSMENQRMLRDEIDNNPGNLLDTVETLGYLRDDSRDKVAEYEKLVLSDLHGSFRQNQKVFRSRIPAKVFSLVVRCRTHNEWCVMNPSTRPPHWPRLHHPGLPGYRGQQHHPNEPMAGGGNPGPGSAANDTNGGTDEPPTPDAPEDPNPSQQPSLMQQTEDVRAEPVRLQDATVDEGATAGTPPLQLPQVSQTSEAEQSRADDATDPPSDMRFAKHTDIVSRLGRKTPVVWVQHDYDGPRARLHVMDVSPGEVHSISHLKRDMHGMKCAVAEDHTVSRTTIGARASLFEKNVMVCRTSHYVWKRHFGHLHVDLCRLVSLVMKLSQRDKRRDAGGWRFDFGNGGRSWSERSDTDDGRGVPRDLVCMDWISSCPTEKDMIAKILDGMQACSDEMCDIAGRPRAFPNQDRYRRHASKLSQAMGCTSSRFEWVTLQLKNLTDGHETKAHCDRSNCSWSSYDLTTAFCVVMVDSSGSLWSLKVLGNSRDVVGRYMRHRVTDVVGNSSPLRQIVTKAKVHLSRLDDSYQRLQSSCRGEWPQAHGLSWDQPNRFFLDDNMDYTTQKLGRSGREVSYITTSAAITRDFWVSPGVHWVHRWRNSGHCRTDLVCLAWLCTHQVSWFKFWTVMPLVERAWDLEDRVVAEFGDFLGGANPRFSPPSFRSVCAAVGGKVGGRHDDVVAILVGLVEWIEDKGDSCDMKGFQQCLHRFNQCLRAHNVELSEFRLTIFVQVVVLSGLARSGYNVLSLSYPVKDRGSSATLSDAGVRREDVDNALHLLSVELGIELFRGDVAECICCELRFHRRHMRDVFFSGMDLFLLRCDYASGRFTPMVKRYGQHHWSKVE